VPPSEEEQFDSYRTVASSLKPWPVTIRTLDLGGDKLASNDDVTPELNPFLGWRAIRYCLVQEPMFREQLRAILRASVFGTVKIMFPMISGTPELKQALGILDQCKAELRAKAIGFDETLECGIMVEVPSAVIIADTLARYARFFSIGTNDLIQYSLAVDRLNDRIAHLYEPTHPAVLALIKMTVQAAQRHGLSVSVCGEMAGDPIMVPLLLGLGVTELSASPAFVPELKFLIRRLKMTEMVALAEAGLAAESAAETLSCAQDLVRQAAPILQEANVPRAPENRPAPIADLHA
jgi:phosphoenolpyruvate-protein phosphotransferase (PTS system enzyme I)